MPVCPETPPCDAACYGACLLTYATYAASVGGVVPMVNLAMQGDAFGIAWAAAAGLGVAGLVAGVAGALTHDDPFRPDRFTWSCGVVLLGSYALLHNWVLTDSALTYHLTRALWLGWMAANAVNIGLQLHRRLQRARRPVRAPVPVRDEPRGLRPGFEAEIEERFINGQLDGGDLLLHYKLLTELKARREMAGQSTVNAPPRVSPDLIHQIDGKLYVQHGETLVPLRAPDTVPVERPR